MERTKVRRDGSAKSSVENVRISKEGVYQIDLGSLMEGSPLVLRIAEGIYTIDLSPSPRLL